MMDLKKVDLDYLMNKPDNDKYLRTELNGISLFQITCNTILTINHNVTKKAFLNFSLLNLDQIQQEIVL